MLFLFLFEQTVLRFIYGVLILCQYCMYNMSNMLIWIIMLSFKIKIKIRLLDQFSENKYMLKFNNGSTTKRCGICLKLIIRAPKRCATMVSHSPHTNLTLEIVNISYIRLLELVLWWEILSLTKRYW